eukprot:TRINITY_DN28596_c0_g2_i1.p1 TRINITY_DN28596_c0_g2~~TRINITY_DN28596_c0_g2_i1.p1  ORF type:complete len:514 (-),score=121.00 TRINITY_DN28596_c0_g2_i1:227-1768(-)
MARVIGIQVIYEPTRAVYEIQVDEEGCVSDLVSTVSIPELTDRIAICRFAGYDLDPSSSIKSHGIVDGAKILVDIDIDEEDRQRELVQQQARKQRQTAYGELRDRGGVLANLNVLLESGVFADLRQESNHLGAILQLRAASISMRFSTVLIFVYLVVFLTGLLGASWMIKTGAEYGGEDCNWSTRNYIGLGTGCMFLIGVLLMHTTGPNFVLPPLEKYMPTIGWHRLMNLTALFWILPVLQWGWVVWGQEDPGCDGYSSDVKIAFYTSALVVFHSSFFAPLLRQRYMHSCELSISQEQNLVRNSLQNSPVDREIDLICVAQHWSHPTRTSGHQDKLVRLKISIDRSATISQLMDAVLAELQAEEGKVEEWDGVERLHGLHVVRYSINQQSEEVQWDQEVREVAVEGLDLDGTGIVGAIDALVPEEMYGIDAPHQAWRCGEEYTTVRMIATPEQTEERPWAGSMADWSQLMETWDTTEPRTRIVIEHRRGSNTKAQGAEGEANLQEFHVVQVAA